MSIIKKFRKQIISKTRIEALTDGVFAIVITLLILEIVLPVHEIANNDDLYEAIKETSPKILSWLLSFWIVSVYWVNHHSIFHKAKKADNILTWLNFGFLMAISFVPFPTGILGEHWDYPIAISFLAINLLLCGFFSIIIWFYILRFLTDEKKIEIKKFIGVLFFGPALYISVIAFSWINIYVAYAFFFTVPIYFMIPRD